MEKYIVTLSLEEAEQLRSLVGKGKHAAQKVINALILLNCDQSQGRGDRRTSQEIAEVLQVSERKIDRVKRRFVEDGLEAALGGPSPANVNTSARWTGMWRRTCLLSLLGGSSYRWSSIDRIAELEPSGSQHLASACCRGCPKAVTQEKHDTA